MSKSEHDEIGEAIEAYLSAIKTGEDGFFERAFYPNSVVINATEEDPEKSIIPIADFINRVKGRHVEGIQVEEIPKGMTVSHVGKAANVRLDFELIISDQTLYGTDYFNLVKRGGEWRISQKIYYVTHQK
jgi:hypothetical protein